VEEAQLIFADEPGVYFTGTPSGVGEIEPGRRAVTGEINFTCTDPFKYSVIEHEVSPLDDSGTTFSVLYQGTVPAFPTLEVAFAPATEDENVDGECGFVAFVNDKSKIIQLGDVDEPDGYEYDMSQTLVNQIFTKYSGTISTNWPSNQAVLQSLAHAVAQTGSVAVHTDETASAVKMIGASAYGTGNYWHGPTITRTIPAQASGHVGSKDWWLTYQQRMCMSSSKSASKEGGMFLAVVSGLENGVETPIAAVGVIKDTVGTTAKIQTYVHNRYKGRIAMQDISRKNVYLGYPSNPSYPSKLTTAILKTGNRISFNIAGHESTYTDDAIADMEATKVSFYFAAQKTNTPIGTNGLYWARFVNLACDTWREVPNKFSSGDVVTADCAKAEVLLNNLPMPSLGALGNDWEMFCLTPGSNQIMTAYSDWVTAGKEPTFKMRYREVFL